MSEIKVQAKRRNKGFDATHDAIIQASVRLIAEKGVDALSMAAIPRAVGINRTTLYYHFEDREALTSAVKLWSSQQLSRGFESDVPGRRRALISLPVRFSLPARVKARALWPQTVRLLRGEAAPRRFRARPA